MDIFMFCAPSDLVSSFSSEDSDQDCLVIFDAGDTFQARRS